MNSLREILSKSEWHEISKLNDVIRRTGIGQIQPSGDEFPFGMMISLWCEQYLKSNARDSELIAFCERMREFSGASDGEIDRHLKSFLGLGNVPRSGWMRVIPELKNKSGESVAQHSIKTAFYAGCLCTDDFSEAFLMGLVHDHAELVVGDLTPEQVSNHGDKIRTECNAYRRMLSEVELPKTAVERLWRSFEKCMTGDSTMTRCLHLADKIDMALQALTYERRYHVDLQEFLDSSWETILKQNVKYGMISKS